jgi:regulatory associated protein of mTOR
VPGQLSDRRTMLGELNWIFTAITDTIAWNTLPRGKLSNNKYKFFFKFIAIARNKCFSSTNKLTTINPTDLFQKLFRQDLLVASLFRNFLLAERIMRSYDCVPVSSPSLPPTYQVQIYLSSLDREVNQFFCSTPCGRLGTWP